MTIRAVTDSNRCVWTTQTLTEKRPGWSERLNNIILVYMYDNARPHISKPLPVAVDNSGFVSGEIYFTWIVKKKLDWFTDCLHVRSVFSARYLSPTLKMGKKVTNDGHKSLFVSHDLISTPNIQLPFTNSVAFPLMSLLLVGTRKLMWIFRSQHMHKSKLLLTTSAPTKCILNWTLLLE